MAEVSAWDSNMSQEGSMTHASSATGTSSTLEMPQWPADMNIVFLLGTRKVALTCQHPMVHIVIQDGMEKVQVDLLINHAFPDPSVALATVKEALITSALQCPAASDIHRRLMFDDVYMNTLMPLMHSSILMIILLTLLSGVSQIPLFQSKVKDRCNAIVLTDVLAIRLADNIKSYISKQFSTYNYTFPTRQGVSDTPTVL
jgi:hypothetical protein